MGEVHAGVTVWYYYDESGICGMNYSGADYFFQKDIFGNIVAIYSKAGVLQCTYTYDAWGNITQTNFSGSTIGNINPFRYRGYYQDQETGFYYLNSRYYDPQTGRYINADEPMMLFITGAEPMGANLFAYFWNNPVMYTDPTGYGPGYENAYPESNIGTEYVPGSLLLLLILLIVGVLGPPNIGTVSTSNPWTTSVSNTSISITGLQAIPDILEFAKPGIKRKGLEKTNKSRQQPGFEDRSGRRRPPKEQKHTPGRGHRKYKIIFIDIDDDISARRFYYVD